MARLISKLTLIQKMMMRYSLISPFLACEVTPLPDRTVQHIKLQELDRLRPGLDLSSYYDRSQNSQAISLKLNPIGKLRRLCMAWDEPHLYKSIPPHPNIVSFGRNLLEDVDSRVTGITTKYIPGGTFDKPRSHVSEHRPSKIYLSTPKHRNPFSSTLARGHNVAGVAFTCTELITGDLEFAHIPHWDRHIDMIQDMPEWTCKCELGF
ncbi:hypothetical protein F5B17DRAFT_430693 [Nemania serpens]|nr:hypothetical protein F5B17DRAFT_430693 [Nemania serpens]